LVYVSPTRPARAGADDAEIGRLATDPSGNARRDEADIGADCAPSRAFVGE